MLRTAITSASGKYRYSLKREWDETKPNVMFLMLNPTLVGDESDDNTIIKCILLAQQWGYGSMEIGCLFAAVASDPNSLLNITNQVGGFLNIDILNKLALDAEKVICCWGHYDIISQIALSNGFEADFYQRELTKRFRNRLYYLEVYQDTNTPKGILDTFENTNPIKYEFL